MARTTTVLTPTQIEAVEAVKVREAQRRELRAVVEQEARDVAARYVEERMTERETARDRAVVRAIALGVPKSHLTTIDILGTAKDGVNRILRAMRERGEKVDLTIAAAPSLRWIDETQTVAHVSLPGFPTTSNADDYPDPLVGVVRRAPGTDAGWAVDVDPTDVGGANGHLRWEMALPLSTNHVAIHLDRLADLGAELGEELDEAEALA